MYCLLMSEPQKTTACHIHAAPALCRERHSSMSYCNWCTLGEFCCYKIVAMRLIKRSANIQQNAFGCYFCPFLCSSKNSMLTKKCTLCFFVNAHAKKHTYKEGLPPGSKKRESRFKSVVWEEKVMAQPGRYPLQKAAFLKSKLCSEQLALKGWRRIDASLVNCQLTPFFNELPRSLWLSYPGDSGRVSFNSSWDCQNRKKGGLLSD